MLTKLADYFKIQNELCDEKKAEIIFNHILKKIDEEKNFYKFISLHGINNIIKIINATPGFKYYKLIKNSYSFFENYYFNASNTLNGKTNKIIKIIKRLEGESELPKLITNLCEDQCLKKLLTLSFILNSNNKIFSLMVLLCLIKKKRKNIIFEYDDESIKDNIFDIFKINGFNKINVVEITKEDILYVKLLNKKISCEYMKQKNIIYDAFETNDFEIVSQHFNRDKLEKKIINIKTFFNKEIKNMIPTEIDKRFESIERKIEEMSNEREELKEEINKQKREKEELKEEINRQKNEINKQKNEINSNKNEINSNKNEINKLNAKIEKLSEDKKKYDNLKGRTIFKSFIDYLFLIFDIKIDLNYSDKKEIIKKKSGKYYRDIIVIIKRMKDLYHDQTKIAHDNPTYDEITSSILAQYVKKKIIICLKLWSN